MNDNAAESRYNLAEGARRALRDGGFHVADFLGGHDFDIFQSGGEYTATGARTPLRVRIQISADYNDSTPISTRLNLVYRAMETLRAAGFAIYDPETDWIGNVAEDMAAGKELAIQKLKD